MYARTFMMCNFVGRKVSVNKFFQALLWFELSQAQQKSEKFNTKYPTHRLDITALSVKYGGCILH